MENDFKFETFLFLSPEKIILSVNQKKDLKSIYKKEFLVENNLHNLNFEKIDKFFNENIFKIERNLNSFIQKINIAVFSEDIFKVKISVKKNNYNKIINNSSLIYLLNEAKDDCNELN